MKELIKKNRYILYAIVTSTILVIWLQREILIVSTGFGYRILELLFTICMVIAITWVIYYLILDKNDRIDNRVCLNYYLKLFLVQTCAFLPMYTQNFMYGDDLWGFASDFNGLLTSGLFFSRPFISFLLGMVNDTSFLSIKYFRICNGVILLLFGCIFFRYLAIKLRDFQIAFLVSVLAIAGCAAVDCVAYASIFPINMSLLLSSISFVIYLKARKTKGKYKLILLVESGVCLFSAFCMYQIGTPIVFLMYVIAECGEELKEKKQNINMFKKAFLYLIYYGITAVLYLFITNILQMITGFAKGMSSRGKIITSISLLKDKMKWFITDVCPQTLRRLPTAFFGNKLFVENNMFYRCTYSKREIGTILGIILVILMLISIIVRSYRQKSLVYALIATVAIPLSFWPFLVLPESEFLTYYSMDIILLFLWYTFDGLIIVLKLLANRVKYIKSFGNNRGKLVVGIITVIVILQSNNYAENAWVNYCRDSYEYLANLIMSELNNRDNVDTIIVQGSISPYVGGHEYVIFCVNDILHELGLDADSYKVVQRENEYYLFIFSDNEFPHMENVLEKEKLDNLLQYYVHDDTYGRWIFTGIISEQSELDFLKACFEQAGLMAVENDSTILINMDGFNIRNPF